MPKNMKQRIEPIFVFTYLFIHSLSDFFFFFPSPCLCPPVCNSHCRPGEKLSLLLFSCLLNFSGLSSLCELFLFFFFLSYFPLLFEHRDILTSLWFFGRQISLRLLEGESGQLWQSKKSWIKLMRVCAQTCQNKKCLGMYIIKCG